MDISWTELMVVAMVAIIVVGPKELPGMLRSVGKIFGQVRRTAREFQGTFNEALREAERQASLDDVKKELDEVRRIDPTKDLRSTVNAAQKDLNAAVSRAGPASASASAASSTPPSAAPDAGSMPAAPAGSAPGPETNPVAATAESRGSRVANDVAPHSPDPVATRSDDVAGTPDGSAAGLHDHAPRENDGAPHASDSAPRVAVGDRR